jgi:hypothetical protein
MRLNENSDVINSQILSGDRDTGLQKIPIVPGQSQRSRLHTSFLTIFLYHPTVLFNSSSNRVLALKPDSFSASVASSILLGRPLGLVVSQTVLLSNLVRFAIRWTRALIEISSRRQIHPFRTAVFFGSKHHPSKG